MTPQEWILAVFIFAFGGCIGSFLNVVIYRLPREKSLVSPGSACPKCGRAIRFYDNIPLLSWIVLGAKCRYCRARISARYFIIELLTASVFLGLYVIYFHTTIRPTMQVEGGWFVYLLHLILVAAFIAASGIDLELWIIPLSICWFVTGIGFLGSAVGGFFIHSDTIGAYSLLPTASPRTAALAVGAAGGLAVSLVLLRLRVLKRSYDLGQAEAQDRPAVEQAKPLVPGAYDDPEFNHRLEALRELVFLSPIVIGSLFAYGVLGTTGAAGQWWSRLAAHPAVAGLLGSAFGYFVGCAVVWATRVFGTLAFGKEAMGLGDVHLMGAAGAVIGPLMVIIAFFIAPFFGLGWALCQMFFKKIRQIPYGPFLSLAVLVVMIFHEWILSRVAHVFYMP